MGRIVEKPQGLSGKKFTRGEADAQGFSKGEPEGRSEGLLEVMQSPVIGCKSQALFYKHMGVASAKHVFCVRNPL